MNKTTLKLTRTALVASAALVLSALEMALPDIPIPFPGIKLGLSNIAVMFSLAVLDLPSAMFVCLVKAVFALLTRGFTAFLMSLFGGLISTFVMFLMLKVKRPVFGYLGIGIAGAFFHNFGQLIVAFFMTDRTVFAYLPILSLSALAAGSLTALVLYLSIPPLTKINMFREI